jgi:nicotinate-nucleotide pyrophosphorylase (carboxylating)
MLRTIRTTTIDRTAVFDLPESAEIIAAALAEDLGVDVDAVGGDLGDELLRRDVTTAAVVDPDARFAGVIRARQDCVVCGLPVAARTFESLGDGAGLFDAIEVFPLVAEGTQVQGGTSVAEVEGLASVVLAGERTALDFLMVLSGIATRTAEWVAESRGRFAVCDTRKTVPGLRALSKYAVRVGGGTNHRAGLYDMVLVKDNHLRHAGGVTGAVGRARLRFPELEIEVEADSLADAVEAVAAGADYVLLDNMTDAQVAAAVSACREAAAKRGRPVALELSGDVRFERLAALRDAGLDRVSSSALTLAPPVDFGLDEV